MKKTFITLALCFATLFAKAGIWSTFKEMLETAVIVECGYFAAVWADDHNYIKLPEYIKYHPQTPFIDPVPNPMPEPEPEPTE